MADKKIRWGIMGPGDIARSFAEGLKPIPEAELTAVASKSQERADKFGEEFGVSARYADYGELAADPNVDIVYVATLNPAHKDCCLAALNGGKAVLCEKPFAINGAETEEVIRSAREKNLFLMEAMWTRFLPAIAKVREWLDDGSIGEVRVVSASAGFKGGWDPSARDLDIDLGGGALLDMGVYPIALVSMVFGGPPEAISSQAYIGETGVDEQLAIVMKYGRGALAQITTAIQCSVSNDVAIYGTEGQILIPGFWHADQATLKIGRNKVETAELPPDGNGYTCEAAEAMKCMSEGKVESEIMALDESLSIMKTMDELRGQWGLVYPTE